MAIQLSTQRPQSLTRRPFQSLFRNSFFDDMLERHLATNGNGELAELMQVSMDVAETDNSFEVTVDLPGIKQNDVDIQLEHNTLTVRGERAEEKEEKDEEKKYHRIERFSGSFARSILLPDSVNEDEASADYQDGVLKIVIPKSEESKPRKISIKSWKIFIKSTNGIHSVLSHQFRGWGFQPQYWTFAGTREEVLKAIEEDKALPKSARDHLLRGLDMKIRVREMFNPEDFFKSSSFPRELFDWPNLDF